MIEIKKLIMSEKTYVNVKIALPIIILLILISSCNNFVTKMDTPFNPYNSNETASLLALTFGVNQLGTTLFSIAILITLFILYTNLRENLLKKATSSGE